MKNTPPHCFLPCTSHFTLSFGCKNRNFIIVQLPMGHFCMLCGRLSFLCILQVQPDLNPAFWPSNPVYTFQLISFGYSHNSLFTLVLWIKWWSGILSSRCSCWHLSFTGPLWSEFTFSSTLFQRYGDLSIRSVIMLLAEKLLVNEWKVWVCRSGHILWVN